MTRWLRRSAQRWGPPGLLLAALVGAWQLWVVVDDTPAYLLPSPGRVATAFWRTRDLLPGHVATTVGESLLGLLAGATAGVAIALLLVSVPLARRVLEPILVTSQTVPMIVLAPLLAVWFGIGLMPKVVVVALITFFPVAISTAAGLSDADRGLVDLLRSMGADRRQVLRIVAIPAAVPAFFAGLRIAAAYAVAGAVIGELVAGESGLGVFINRSKSSFRIDQVFVAVVVIAVLSSILFGLIGLGARLAAPWKQAPDRPLEPT